MAHAGHGGHGAPHTMPPGLRHVCMMEGPDPLASLQSSRYDSLAEENARNLKELERLKALLLANNIDSTPPPPKKIGGYSKRRMRTRSFGPAVGDEELPNLPIEILLKIMGFALTNKTPIIDPFYKLCHANITKAEQKERKSFCTNMMATCRVLNVEGIKLLVSNNDFIFTQAAALANFAKFPLELRNTINEVTFRVVGRYYDDRAGKRDLTDNSGYHYSIDKLVMPISARPPGMVKDKGIQAYCWEQVNDFLKAMIIPVPPMSRVRPRVLPNLRFLRFDLVNFVDHLPYGGFQFCSLVRWHIGQMVDELIITGAPAANDGLSSEEKLLHNLVRDEGLIGSGSPHFVSTSNGLKTLNTTGLFLQLVRAGEDNSATDEKKFEKAAIPYHPKGESPPESQYPLNRTIWKWVSQSSIDPKRSWVEFDRRSGYPAEDVEWTDDEGEDNLYDSDGWPSDVDMDGGDEDNEEDGDDAMPELVDP